jgi:hypothetical protein
MTGTANGNQWVGYYPTVQAACGAVTTDPLPDQVDANDMPALRNTSPTTGKLVKVNIPDTASGFKHRSEYAYLPPAWFAGPATPPLPVVMTITGEFSTPSDWLRGGNVIPIIDGYANSHGGEARAPNIFLQPLEQDASAAPMVGTGRVRKAGGLVLPVAKPDSRRDELTDRRIGQTEIHPAFDLPVRQLIC